MWHRNRPVRKKPKIFKEKVRLAKLLLSEWHCLYHNDSKWHKSATVRKDGLCIQVVISRYTKGVAKGQPNECRLNWQDDTPIMPQDVRALLRRFDDKGKYIGKPKDF